MQNECALAGVDFDGFVSFIGAPHGDCGISGFVLFQREEARLIKNKTVKSIMPLRSEESKNIV